MLCSQDWPNIMLQRWWGDVRHSMGPMHKLNKTYDTCVRAYRNKATRDERNCM